MRAHQQLRSYGDGATTQSLIRQAEGALGTRQVVYPPHHGNSYLLVLDIISNTVLKVFLFLFRSIGSQRSEIEGEHAD